MTANAWHREREGTIQPMILALAALACLAVRLAFFAPPEAAGFDEHAYGKFSEILRVEGLDGIRGVAARYGEDPEITVSPLPYRIGFIALGALAGATSDPADTGPLAAVAMLAGAGLVFGGFLLARAWFGGVTGWFALPLLLSSPLAVHLSRRALQDTLMAVCLVFCMWFLHRVWLRGRRVDALGLGLAALAGFLVKESMLFLYPSLALACLVYLGLGHRQLRPVLVALGLAPIFYLLVMGWIAGDLETFFRVYFIYSEWQYKIPYAVMFQKGPWFRYFIDLMLVSPLVFLAGLAAVVRGPHGTGELGRHAKPAEWNDRNGMLVLTVYLLSGLVIFGNLPILNARLILHLDALLRVGLAAGLVIAACRISHAGLTKAKSCMVAAGIVLVLVASDCVQTERLFGREGIYDPVTAQLFQRLGFANPPPASGGK